MYPVGKEAREGSPESIYFLLRVFLVHFAFFSFCFCPVGLMIFRILDESVGFDGITVGFDYFELIY